MRCDLDCPVAYGGPKKCCKNCRNSKGHLKSVYPDEWIPTIGFLRKDGCVLGEDRPQECKDYDCKQYIFYSVTLYKNGVWTTAGLHEIPLNNRSKELRDRYNALLREYKT